MSLGFLEATVSGRDVYARHGQGLILDGPSQYD
jgi:hypothetical protein